MSSDEHEGLTICRSPFMLLQQQHTGCLIQPQHDVHVLHGNSAGPLDQIIDCRKDHQLVSIEANSDVTKVCEGNIFRVRNVVNNPNERLPRIKAAVDLQQLSLRLGSFQAWIDGAKDSSIHRHQMRIEGHLHSGTTDVCQHLFYLRRMSMFADAVSRYRLIALREQIGKLWRPPCPADTAFASIMIPVGSITFACSKGARARMDVLV
jgi:hypothetical protein